MAHVESTATTRGGVANPIVEIPVCLTWVDRLELRVPQCSSKTNSTSCVKA